MEIDSVFASETNAIPIRARTTVAQDPARPSFGTNNPGKASRFGWPCQRIKNPSFPTDHAK